MTEWAYVNGEFCELSQARVSVEDRGFQFADGIYEVVLAYNRRPFRLPQHLRRFRRSAEAIRLDFDFDAGTIERVVAQGIERCTFDDVHIYLQLTRGTAARVHRFPTDARPTFVATFKPRREIDARVRRDGYALITVPDERWANCYVKSVALLPNVLARQRAIDAGADEAVFVSPEGHVLEGTSANLFAWRDGTLATPPLDRRLLAGITREYLLECAARLSLPTAERSLTVDEVLTADEVLVTSTAVEVLGVVRIDGRTIGSGVVGEITRRLASEFTRGVREACGR